MRVIIIEDEELASKRLEGLILKTDPNIKIEARLESVSEAVEWFGKNPEPDLIFLDIHLEDDLSFAIFEKVKVKAPVIFTTAFDEYAIKAFKLKSIDYLLKPINQKELNEAIAKYKEWTQADKPQFDMSELYKLLQNKDVKYKERFSISFGQKIKTIETEKVAYFFSEGGLTFLVTTEKSEYPIDYSLDDLASQVDPRQFFRINRQYLVKLKSIKNVHVFPKSHLKLDLEPAAKAEVFVSIDKVTRFKDWLDS